MWSVPLSPGDPPAALLPPVRLPQHHTRSVFSIDFGPLCHAEGGQPSAADQPLTAAGQSPVTSQPSAAIAGGATTPAAAAAIGTAAAQPPPIGMLTTSMDRSAALWRLGQLPLQLATWKTAKVHLLQLPLAEQHLCNRLTGAASILAQPHMSDTPFWMRLMSI